MPRGIRLVMCDVDCGSETVGLVKKVLAWRAAEPDTATLLWTTLQKGNEDLATELQKLTLNPEGKGDQDPYESLKSTVLTIRSLIRDMSARADVPIEPKVQTDLLDACARVPGVIGGVVPGAGGFDAIALLVEEEGAGDEKEGNNEGVVRRLQQFLDGYKADAHEGDGGPSIGKVRLLGVKQEMAGVKSEEVGMYGDWIPPA